MDVAKIQQGVNQFIEVADGLIDIIEGAVHLHPEIVTPLMLTQISAVNVAAKEAVALIKEGMNVAN